MTFWLVEISGILRFAPCHAHFLVFSVKRHRKTALSRRKNTKGTSCVRCAAIEPQHCSCPVSKPKQKRHPFGCLFLYGGDKRDRTADLMTASCDRFVILSVFSSNTSVPPAKSAGFCKVLSIASTRFRAHLGHNLGQDKQGIRRIPDKAGADCSLKYMISQA